MKLAINYSPAARTLLEEGAIDFDLWKCAPEHPHLTADARACCVPCPLYLHFPLDVGAPDFAERTDWSEVERLLGETGTPFVNVHLNARREHFPEVNSGTDPERERAAVCDRFLRHLGLAAARVGADRLIAENVIYQGEGAPCLRASVEPDLICDVVRESACGLLLDTAHARVTCEYLFENLSGGNGRLSVEECVTEYIAALPCGRLRELHVTGAQYDLNGRLRDSMPMTDGDWRTARWVLQEVRAGRWPAPWAVALEYGGVGPSYEWRSDPQVIAEQLPELRAMLLEEGSRA